MSAPVPSQDQEADDDVPLPAAAAAVLPVPVPAAGEIPVPPVPAAGEVQAVDREILEADLILLPVEDNLFARVFILPNPMASRYVYAVLFASWMTMVAFMPEIELPRFERSGCDGSLDCITADAVLRATMALAIFFFIMFLSTVNTTKRYELRNFWHCQSWTAKAAIFVVGSGFSLYAPSSSIQLYGMVAHVGAWLFLVIQFFTVTRFIMWANTWCRVESNHKIWAQMTYGLLPLSAAPVVLYLGSFLGLGFMYYWYAPYQEPTTFIYISVAMSVICLISCVCKVSGGYLAPGLMMAYVVLMCWTVIRSEPHMETSNKKTKHTADWQNILSLVIAVVVIITSTYTVGKDSKCIKFSYTPELGDDIPYGYGFFI
uniref:Uncharacterized protein n=1 Tax=Avena sativa TaxID=4498 RepID=A0ACD5VE18_AVESA